MTRQYPLPLPHREALAADDFFVTNSNREALGWIDKWPDWPAPCLTIYGPAGSGKTHLAHVWQERSRAKFVAPENISRDQVGTLVMTNNIIAIDNAGAVAGNPAREQGLFHLYNIVRETKGWLLLTARLAPAQWRIGLPDLRSRLLAAPAIALGAPDDELLSALMLKQFGDRQLAVGADVIDFLLPRLTRTPEAIRDIVSALDRASLAESRGITVSLARRILESMNAS
ncbi:MAG: DnaA/Hda family protein [Bdellovibrionales bacterium]